MSLGLQRGYVSLEPHSIEWEISASVMIELLKNILKDVLVDAQHIGSTSIKTVPAKPIIDIAVGVFSFEKLMKCNGILLEHGIIYRGQDHADQHLYVCGDFQRDITNGKHDFIVNILKKAEEWTCSIGI